MTTLAGLLGGGGAPEYWVSGRTVQQGETVRSLADHELYTRRTATGSGATDPADDIVNFVAASYRRITSLQPWVTSATVASGWSATTVAAADVGSSVPTLAAATRSQALSLSGRGVVQFLAFRSAALSGTLRIEVFVDGRSVYDQTVTTSGATGQYVQLIGALVPTVTSGDYMPVRSDVEFKRSFAVYFTSSSATSTGRQLWYANQGEA